MRSLPRREHATLRTAIPSRLAVYPDERPDAPAAWLYTGDWVTWYVNGHANGPDTGWYANGRKAYEGQYEHDHQVGTWTHRYEDGSPKHISTYRAGKLNGASTTFFPTGRQQYEVNYTDGLQNGTDTAWDETGKVLWARRFEMGKMAE